MDDPVAVTLKVGARAACFAGPCLSGGAEFASAMGERISCIGCAGGHAFPLMSARQAAQREQNSNSVGLQWTEHVAAQRGRSEGVQVCKKVGRLPGAMGGVVSGPKSFRSWVYGATRRPGTCLLLIDDKFGSANSAVRQRVHPLPMGQCGELFFDVDKVMLSPLSLVQASNSPPLRNGSALNQTQGAHWHPHRRPSPTRCRPERWNQHLPALCW